MSACKFPLLDLDGTSRPALRTGIFKAFDTTTRLSLSMVGSRRARFRFARPYQRSPPRPPNFGVARHLTNRGLDLANLREQRFMHGHLVCAARRSAVADAPITRAPRG